MDGLVPALSVGAGAVAVAAVLAFLIPRRGKADGPAVSQTSGDVAVEAPLAI